MYVCMCVRIPLICEEEFDIHAFFLLTGITMHEFFLEIGLSEWPSYFNVA